MNRRDAIRAVMAMPAVVAISRASLKPGDVIVVECHSRLSLMGRENITRSLKKVWPDQKCVVLDEGMTLKVVSHGQQ